ncbi:MAG: hypothetical protein WCO63_04300 [Bacteroidota bacterium]
MKKKSVIISPIRQIHALLPWVPGKISIWLIFIMTACLFLSSCCNKDSVETARLALDSAELKLIPYKLGEQYKFVHSNGFGFYFTVTEDKLQWYEQRDLCEWNCCGKDYYSYQVRTAKLVSEYPKLTIELFEGERAYDYYPRMLSLSINNRHYCYFPYDSLAHFMCDTIQKTYCHDSIMINNKIYTHVVEAYVNNYSFTADSTILLPEWVYYNKLGLLQIKMSNHETYSLDQ